VNQGHTLSNVSEEPSSFDARALELDQAIRQYSKIGNHWIRYQFVKRLISDHRVLELGCGFGLGATLLADSVSDYIGVDSYEPGIEWARTKIAPLRDRLLFKTLAEFHNTPLERTFDVGLAFEVLEHVGDPTGFLTMISRRLRPGGTLVLSTPNGFYSQHDPRLFRTPFHVDEYSIAELLELLAPFSESTRFYIERRRDRLDVLWLAINAKIERGLEKRYSHAREVQSRLGGPLASLKRVAYNSLNAPLLWEIEELSGSSHSDSGFSTIIAVSVVR
jgi:2-polyprenyl-3-methyl-5-hydroxy-6-metoxy-1,4-benzoquinol methylase